MILISLLAVSAVSAAENATDDAVCIDDVDEDIVGSDVEGNNLKYFDEDTIDNNNSNSPDDYNDVLAEGTKTFKDLYDDVYRSTGDTIYLNDDYVYTGDKYDGISIVRPLTIYGNGHTLDGAGSAAIFIVGDTKNGHGVKTTIHDTVFVNGYAKSINQDCHGGAVRDLYGGFVTLVNCTFIDNHAENYGGAIYKCNAKNCRFVNNSAASGGALFEGKAIDCSFYNNSATSCGGAIFTSNQDFDAAQGSIFVNNSAWEGGAIYCGVVRDCTFTDNHARHEGGAICVGTAYHCDFKANSAQYGGALAYCLADDCYFEANSAQDSGGAMYKYKAVNCNFVSNSANCGGAIFAVNNEGCTFRDNVAPHGPVYSNGTVIYIPSVYEYYNSTYCFAVYFYEYYMPYTEVPIANATLSINFNGLKDYTTDSNGKVIFSTQGLDPGTYTLEASFAGDEFYGPQFASRNITVSKWTSSITSSDVTTDYGVQKYLFATLKDYHDNPMVGFNVTVDLGVVKFDLTTDADGKFNISTAGLLPNVYTAVIKFAGTKYYGESSTRVKVTVKHLGSKLAASNVVQVYNKGKTLVATLKGVNGKSINGRITLKISNGYTKTIKTTNGRAKFLIPAKLVPKTYKAKIKFLGNKYYAAASKSVKVTVKKDKTKLFASGKSFKVKTTKKISARLKDSKNRAIKKKLISFKVAGKTYKVKTNSKGVATVTVKITKKGPFKTVIKFAGDKCYNKCSKKIKLKIK